MTAEIPVSIIGLGGRFPGGSNTPALFYEFLRHKGDGMVEPPPDRWDHAEFMGGKDEPGKYHTAKGGFITDIDMFDALEFGISAKEAPHFDAAIRLTLEASHQALQDSGIDYRGSKTGVYFGNLLTTNFELDEDRFEINSYNGIGKCVSIRANRISFTFDLRGPSLTVDTACSASATAIHLALSAIRSGEIDQALAATHILMRTVGANTMINPEHTVSFSKLGVLSPTGSSKSFDASADGYARAEAAVAVVIKRQDLVERDGDLAYAVITGSSINANGKGKSLTMPEGAMQAETIKCAYSAAKRDPSEAFYVELHATGTKVGDPIEANAAGKVFSVNRPDHKVLRVGSVKSNIGHAEGCSFLASLVKVSMMLHHHEIIPNIRFNTPNPGIDFVGGKMRVQTELEEMTFAMAANDGKWITSVSSYGVGGSNAHVVLESSRSSFALPGSHLEMASSSPGVEPLRLFSIGTLTEASLIRWQEALCAAFQGTRDDRTLRSISYHLARQARACPARSYAIAPFLSPETKFSKPVLVNDAQSPKLCLVFSGQGPQHISMGRQLAAAYPAFLNSVHASDRILVDRYANDSMLARTGLFAPGVEPTLASNGAWPVNEVVLSLVFVQIALVDLLQNLGLQYDFVVGHSLGEIAMGYASGHYSREMAVGIAVARATAMLRAEGNGAMVALGVGVQKAKAMIKKVLRQASATTGLWIAGINSPEAVTVAGKHELVDALVGLAKDPAHSVFAAKLRVGCAFHTPLMGGQEDLFKAEAGPVFADGTGKKMRARVMSTNDGGWLNRDLDLDYCWDNIRRPVLFGTAINKLIDHERDNGLVFLEIAPHPVLKSYVEQCGGQAISLIRRPNPKLPAESTGEQAQLLEGIGELLSTGFKGIDLKKLCASTHGEEDFVKFALPDYPYNKARCWAESGSERSMRLLPKQRPLAPPHFRVNVDSHPDLVGHIIFDAPLFPASGYVESILENGAMLVQDVAIHKPLVLKGHGTMPTHAGCIIDGNRWQFRASTSDTFDNGAIVLDTVYASGTFSRVNPAFRADAPLTFDFKSKLALSCGSVTGDEFYSAIPSAYRYEGHFRDYLQEVFEVTDDESWGGKAYLARLEVPEGSQGLFGKGYVIHPGILDSITQCGLAMFINMTTKLFDFNGVFLPVKIDALRRWDSADSPDLDAELKQGIWAYFTGRTWAPLGPFKSDYIIANSQGRVLFTIEGFEISRAPGPELIPINDQTLDARLTTIWQPKVFPSYGQLTLDNVSFSTAFQTIVMGAARAGRRVFRVLDVDETADIAALLDSTLTTLRNNHQLHVEYHCGGISKDAVNACVASMSYDQVRPLVVGSWTSEDISKHSTSFDLVLGASAQLALDVSRLPGVLVPSGVVLIVSGPMSLTTSSFSIEPLISHDEAFVQSGKLLDNRDIIAFRVNRPSRPWSDTANTVIIHPFVQGKEGDLISVVRNLTSDCELWISADDSAAGIGAMGVAACLIAEFPEFEVRSVLFEDHSLSQEARQEAVHNIRLHSGLLEQHMKVSRAGQIYVRRLVYGSPAAKKPVTRYSTPPAVCGSKEIMVKVDLVGFEPSLPFVTYVGTSSSSSVVAESTDVKVLGISLDRPTDTFIAKAGTEATIPAAMSLEDATKIPLQFLEAWIALKSVANISKSSRILILGGATVQGRGAIQLCQRFGAVYFCTVDSAEEAASLVRCFGIPVNAVLLSGDYRTSSSVDKIGPLTVVLDCTETRSSSLGVKKLSATGWYIRLEKAGQAQDPLPRAPFVFNLNMTKLLADCSEIILSALEALLAAHQCNPFTMEEVLDDAGARADHAPSGTLSQLHVAPPLVATHANSTGQLFDPRKSYILVGGCSELGVRIAEWMATLGARHIFLTSRRGSAGLSKVDQMYLHYLRRTGVKVDVIAADAVRKDATIAVIRRAQEYGDIGGVFLMTVVLRDAKFENLSQQAFDDVRQSKVDALSTLLECLDPAELDFLLLFSTIGSVFGNAGQAAYCASQLYLDRIADVLPNTISISLPPITDSGIFKRLVLSTRGLANTQQLSKTGMTTAQVCNFLGDCLLRSIPHYVPMLSVEDVPQTFPGCEPMLYHHLLPAKAFNLYASSADDQTSVDSPASLLAGLLGLEVSQITDNALITSFGLDSLGATRFSNLLKSRFGISVSQIELLGSMSIAKITQMILSLNSENARDESSPKEGDGQGGYGAPLTPILNGKLAFDEPYITDASPHQYRIWLAQREHDVERSAIARSKPGNTWRQALQWDTHEGYMVTIHFEEPFSADRFDDAFQEVVQRHGALRTAFSWNERLAKLEQTVLPSVDLRITYHDLSSEPDGSAKAYELSMNMNDEPNFSLDSPPLLLVSAFDLGGGDWTFTVVIHHIIIDEASVALLFSELFALYDNGPGCLPDMKIHYSDFSDWLIRTSSRREELKEEQLKFWVEFLQDSEPLHCCLATPSSKVLATITQIDTFISEDILRRFTAVIKDAHATAFAVFFAAYNILLHKYSSQATFAVGTAVTQRTLPSLSNVIGMFANVLPIKTSIREDNSFAEYLAHFKETLIECLANGDVGYEDIVASGKASPRERGHFKHLFTLGGLDAEALYRMKSDSFEGISAISLPNKEEQYELLLTVHPRTGCIVLRFDRHSFTEHAARQFLDAYVALIGTLANNPAVKIRDICVLEECQRERLLNHLSTEEQVPVRDDCLHHLFEEQVSRTPSLTAVEFEGQSCTYEQLNYQANGLAQILVEKGVRRGDSVAVCFDRGIHQILAILSVLKAGASFVPLDPDGAALRKQEMIEDCGTQILLTSSVIYSGSLGSVQVVHIDDPMYETTLSASTSNVAMQHVSGASIAYIMFTSGSTGKPKGVVVEHRSICNLVRSSQVYGFRHGTRVMSSLTYTFDPFIVDMFGTLCKGGTLVTGRKEMVLGNIPAALRNLRINVLHVTPSILASVPVDDYPHLETVVVAGEELPKKLIDDWAERVTFRNMYGPTEASVDCISCQVTPSSQAGDIGRPLPNNRVYILNKHLQPVPIGVEGHLYIGGIQLARGYLNQPELTAQVFIASPFVSGERIYKTGDLALFRPDGTIQYRGREDRQIKLCGQRVELTAVEDVISRCPVVRRCAVMIRTVHAAHTLVAFVEFVEEAAVAAANAVQELESSIKDLLPRFMHPSVFVPLPTLPTSASGKIDHKALLELDLEAYLPSAAIDFVPPQSDIESEMLSLFSRVLKISSKDLSVTQELFNAGMTSLMAVQAAGGLFDTFGVHVSLRNIYTRPTIRELADLVTDMMAPGFSTQDTSAAILDVLHVNQGGSGPKLFFIHDVTGMAGSFDRLAPYLPNEMHAIQDCHLGSDDGFSSIDAMAEHYLKLVRSIQPSGPYVLCGHSFGGIVAHCMATRLLRAGLQVQHLILLDSVYIPSEVRPLLKSTDWKRSYLDRFLGSSIDVTNEWRDKLEGEISRNMDLMLEHEPEHYSGSATLIVPEDRSWYLTGGAAAGAAQLANDNGWHQRVEDVAVKITAGRHDTLLAATNAERLAEILNEVLTINHS
ncbi:polyketide synthetase [Hydnomerulius pinastri MD-312]|uniref:Pks5 protein n=1 Tax=Hydnomerulius pinastri MD-312 TaxID=994086 RepID=A0A0C9W3L5_9AGAM|nr:polyketide synthetase [Hydnomerulius pinastri MD-312]